MSPDLGNVIVPPTNVTSPTLGNAAFEDWRGDRWPGQYTGDEVGSTLGNRGIVDWLGATLTLSIA